jgi:hypothetical protein
MAVKKEKTKQESLEDSLGSYNALQALSISEGGILLRNVVIKDIIRDVEKISNNYSTYSIQEFISIGANLKVNLAFFNTLKNAKHNANVASEELKEYLEEEAKNTG